MVKYHVTSGTLDETVEAKYVDFDEFPKARDRVAGQAIRQALAEKKEGHQGQALNINFRRYACGLTEQRGAGYFV